MNESEISAELLDAPVSNPDLATIATKLLDDWGELSPHLQLTPQQESAIRQNHVGNYDAQKRGALRRWKKNNGAAATYRAFVAAATAASNMELVDSVKSMLQMREKPTGNSIHAVGEPNRPRAGQNYHTVLCVSNSISFSLNHEGTEKKLTLWDLHGLLFLLVTAARKWREIGSCLQFPKHVLDAIGEKLVCIVGGPGRCLREVLTRWLGRDKPQGCVPSTNHTLVRILRLPEVDEGGLATKVERTFQTAGI